MALSPFNFIFNVLAKIKLHRNLIFLKVVGGVVVGGLFPVVNFQTPNLHTLSVFRVGVVFAGFPDAVCLAMLNALGFMPQRLERRLGGFNFGGEVGGYGLHVFFLRACITQRKCLNQFFPKFI